MAGLPRARASAAWAQGPAVAARLEEVARLGGEIGALAATESTAFVAVEAVVEILEAHAAAGTRSLGRWSLGAPVEQAVVAEDRLWLALGSRGFEARSARPPFADRPLLEGPARRAVHAVTARDGTLYVVDETGAADGPPGSILLRVLLEQQGSPREVGSVTLEGRRGDQRVDLALAGRHLFVALGTAGVVSVVDVTDPLVPFHVRDVALGDCIGCLQAIAAHDRRLYAVYAGELLALDIADPTEPVLAGRSSCPGSCFVGDVVADARAVFVAGCNGLCVFEDGAAGGLRHRATLAGLSAEWLASTGDSLVAAGSGRVHGVGVGDLDAPEHAWEAAVLAAVPGPLAATGQSLLLAERMLLRALDVSAPESPSLLGEVDLAADAAEADVGYVADLAVEGEAAFAAVGGAAGGRLVRLDLQPGRAPVATWSLPTSRPPFRLAVARGLAFLSEVEEGGTAGAGTLVIDIASAAPRVASRISASGPLGVSGSWLVIATPTGLEVHDVSDPSRPSRAAVLDGVGGGSDFLIDGAWLYQTCAACADPETALQIVDLTDGRTPQVVASLPGDHGTVQAKLGSWLLTGYSSSGLHVVDVADPTSPIKLAGAGWPGETGGPGTVLDAVVAAGHVYVAGGWEGLGVLASRQVAQTATPAAGSATPSPRPTSAATGAATVPAAVSATPAPGRPQRLFVPRAGR